MRCSAQGGERDGGGRARTCPPRPSRTRSRSGAGRPAPVGTMNGGSAGDARADVVELLGGVVVVVAVFLVNRARADPHRARPRGLAPTGRSPAPLPGRGFAAHPGTVVRKRARWTVGETPRVFWKARMASAEPKPARAATVSTGSPLASRSGQLSRHGRSPRSRPAHRPAGANALLSCFRQGVPAPSEARTAPEAHPCGWRSGGGAAAEAPPARAPIAVAACGNGTPPAPSARPGPGAVRRPAARGETSSQWFLKICPPAPVAEFRRPMFTAPTTGLTWPGPGFSLAPRATSR